ncbi:ribosomal RNA large subunit methyltransferase E [Phanerochaete sordida]|uniref:rRNA methyltransferase 2, mitochondrial n=1 Tax=Phanerochaete sordida TaxID=48140 RepID=A0A9P3LGY9_9APHY|nr:ribosomal RNA large subunit methyltransferase E [Phanerochaete sordida]
MSFSASAVRHASKMNPSSRAWLARQFSDPFVKQRLAHPGQYRARSAFKLLELDAHYRFLARPDVRAVVDLGAAPGGWSQVVAGKLGWSLDAVLPAARTLRLTEAQRQDEALEGFGLARGAREASYGSWSQPGAPIRDDEDPLAYLNAEPEAPPKGRGVIVAVDLLPMQLIPGVKSLKADFLLPETHELIEGILVSSGIPSGRGGMVDIVLSDMAANFSGNSTADIESSLQICQSVLQFTKRHLRSEREIGRKKGGVLVLKHFQHPLLQQFREEELQPRFQSVIYHKPKSSRGESSEGYWVCMGWHGGHRW